MGLSSCVCCFPVGLCPTMADLVGAFVWGGGLLTGSGVFHGMGIFMLHCGIRCLLWNLLLAVEKCGISHFCYILSNLSFFRALFNFTIYKAIKSSHCKLTFMISMSTIT